MNEKSNLFQEVSLDCIRRIFADALGESEIWRAALLDGGLFNTTYFVEYGAGRKRAVLRLGPVNRHCLAGFEETLMQAEVYVDSVCQKIGVPCSRVLRCDVSRRVVDRDFMIVEFIPSVAMSRAELTEERRERLYFQMGRYLAKLHEVTGSGFGFVSRMCAGTSFATWAEALISEARDIAGRLAARGGLRAEEAAAVLAEFERNRALLDEVRVPRLLHADLWEGNVLLDEDTLEIAAIIDGDRAVFGDPDFEFAAPWMERPALLEGYGRAPDAPSSGRAERKRLYRMFYCLLEAYVGYAEYNDSELYADRRARLMELLAG